MNNWPRLLPCRTCGAAKATKTGEPYYLLSWPGGRAPFRYQCRGCWPHGPVNVLTVEEFNLLPRATPDELQRLGILERLTRDLTLGGAVEPAKAAEMFAAGVTVAELEDLPAREAQQE